MKQRLHSGRARFLGCPCTFLRICERAGAPARAPGGRVPAKPQVAPGRGFPAGPPAAAGLRRPAKTCCRGPVFPHGDWLRHAKARRFVARGRSCHAQARLPRTAPDPPAQDRRRPIPCLPPVSKLFLLPICQTRQPGQTRARTHLYTLRAGTSTLSPREGLCPTQQSALTFQP